MTTERRSADLMSRALAATDQLGTALAEMISVLDAVRDSLSMPVQSGFTAPANAPAILEDVAATCQRTPHRTPAKPGSE